MEINILLEMTYNKLISNTDKNFPARSNDSSDVRVKNTIFVPYPNNNSLEIKAETESKTGSKYTTAILFDGVSYVDEENFDTETIISTDGSEHILKKIDRNRQNVKVNCTCLDFYYRFASFNHNHKALLGNPPDPYEKKTDRPPVNPQKVPGVCKHIIRVAEELEKANLFL